MHGMFYGVGVGPGDPELMTLKAVRRIQENEIIALPGEDPRETVAYKIAVQAVPGLAKKTLLPVPMPMVMDREARIQSHKAGADRIESYLKRGENVVFLTLGDPTVYSTFLYVQKYLLERGYASEIVSGVPSFCAAAARANVSLAEWDEPLHVLPAVQTLCQLSPKGSHPAPSAPNSNTSALQPPLNLPGNYVLMKSGSKMPEVKALLRESERDVTMVENCGMPGEKIYRSVEEIPDDAGYYSLIIAKEKAKINPAKTAPARNC